MADQRVGGLNSEGEWGSLHVNTVDSQIPNVELSDNSVLQDGHGVGSIATDDRLVKVNAQSQVNVGSVDLLRVSKGRVVGLRGHDNFGVGTGKGADF